MQEQKTRPLSSFPPPCCNCSWTSGLLSSITCLSSYPIERGYLPYSPPAHPPSICASSHQQMTHKTPSHALHPGYKSELRTTVQGRFSLELAHCSNSVSHSNKLYFPLILSRVWKFFSNPHLDHDNQQRFNFQNKQTAQQ